MSPAGALVAGDPGGSPEHALSIAELTDAARFVVEGGFPALWVRGEVSSFKAPASGHWYFSLRDAHAQIRCVVWATDTLRIPASPDDGMMVTALGQLTVYSKRGELQLRVIRMDAAGDGLWRKALEQAIARLEADGLLAAARKRRLAMLPRRIAVVTSLDGAAVRDIVAVVRRRCPIVEIVIVPARVQGDGAADQVVRAIKYAARLRNVDTVIVGRGGGSREDLWVFNDERVARTLAACKVPTISAVGHEIDTTLCDLVADRRAPTPSAAAELAVPVLADVRASLGARRAALRAALERRALAARRRFERDTADLRRAGERVVERRRARLTVAAGQLDALSPLGTLARGYAVARTLDGRTLSSVAQFAPRLPFRLTLRDGDVAAHADDAAPVVRDGIGERHG